MNKNEALKILDLNPSDNPSKRQVVIRYKELALKFHPDKNQDKEEIVRNEYAERFKQIKNASEYLTSLNLEKISKMKYEDIRMMTDEEFERTTNMTDEEFDEMSNEKFDSWIYTTNKRLMKDLNEINSANDLVLSLKFATLNKDVAYIKQAVSKFKSSKNGQFGDCINRSGLLFFAVSHRDIEFTEFLLKKGVDPNTEISELFLRNDKIKKLLIEYGRYDKSSVLGQFALAVLAGSMAFAIYSSCDASFLCYAGVAAFALAGVFLVANAIHDVFYAQTKWPSPDFDEVSTEKVVTNVELNAEGNSRESGNALA